MNWLTQMLIVKFGKLDFEQLHILAGINKTRWQYLLNDQTEFRYSFDELEKIATIFNLTCCVSCFFKKVIESAHAKGKDLVLTK